MSRAALLALIAVAVTSSFARAQDAGGLDDGGLGDGAAIAIGPDASTRILIDGPTMLGIGRPQVSAAASPSEVRLGDKLTLFIEVVYDEQVTVSVPSGLDLQPVFDELKRSSVDERRSDGTRKRIYQLQLQVWDLGDLRIPPIQVSYTVGGASSWVVTNDVPIRVVGSIDSIDDPNAFLGATPPIGLRRRDWRWVIVGTAIAIVATVGLGVWLYTRRKRRARLIERERDVSPDAIEREVSSRDDGAAPAVSAAPAIPVPSFTPQQLVITHELRRQLGDAARRALDALDALERSGLLVRDQPEAFRKLVAIIHTFAVEQYTLPARHRTSAELVRVLGSTAMPAAALTATTAWLGRCDLVKFAAELDDDDGAGALSDARQLIVLAAAHREGAHA